MLDVLSGGGSWKDTKKKGGGGWFCGHGGVVDSMVFDSRIQLQAA